MDSPKGLESKAIQSVMFFVLLLHFKDYLSVVPVTLVTGVVLYCFYSTFYPYYYNLHNKYCIRIKTHYKKMGKQALLYTLFMGIICLRYINGIDEYGFETLSKLTSSHDFDLLIFTQQWPATACKEWKKHDSSHTCSMPPKVDSWTIHGIWPTKLGQMGPAYCNKTWLFDPEKIRPIENQLTLVWVNIFAGTPLYTLWAHEWNKHGTCAAILEKFNSELKYFSSGLDWLRQYSMFEILQSKGIVPSNSRLYSVNDINNIIKEKLGVDPVIECKKEDGQSFISEIRICFTKDLKISNCDGVIYQDESGDSVLTNCDKSEDVMYPHYVKENSWYIQLYHLVSWLQWFTL